MSSMSTSTVAIAYIAPAARYEALVAAEVARWQVEPIDVTRLGLAEKKATIGIAEVKGWMNQLYRTPRGAVRLAVISDAERLTDAANNALLKLLEEPPAHTRILLLLTRDTLLPTIRSRVRLQYDAVQLEDQTMLSVLPNSVSDIIDTAEEVTKKKTLPAFILNLLTAVRSDLRAGRLTATAAGAIAQQTNRYKPGMNGKVMIESVLLLMREGKDGL